MTFSIKFVSVSVSLQGETLDIAGISCTIASARQSLKVAEMMKEEWVKSNGNFLVDTEDLLEWLIDDTQSARLIFETPDVTAGERLKAYLELRDFSEEERLLLI